MLSLQNIIYKEFERNRSIVYAIASFSEELI